MRVRIGEFRVEADGLIEVGNGTVVLALIVIGKATIVVVAPGFRVGADGLIEVGEMARSYSPFML
jgi:hypothetical protein